MQLPWFGGKISSSSVRYLWIAALLVFALKCAFLLSSTLRGLASTTWIIDDGIIEMAIARNLGHGLGFTLDGLHTTTGAPFLWIYLTSLTHVLFGLEGAVKATLIISTLFGSLSTVLVYAIAHKLTDDRRIAWTAFALATFTGAAFFNAMNGMETGMFTFFVLLSVAMFFGIGRPARWSPLAWGCATGAALGLTVMTRADGLFLMISLFAVALYQWKTGSAAKRKEQTKFLQGMLGAAGLLFAVFMLWQLVRTGSPFPGNQVGRRLMSLSLHGFSFDHPSWPLYFKISAWNVFQIEELLRIAMGSSLLALVALGYGLLHKSLRSYAVILVIYLGVFFALLAAYQWYFPDFHGLRYLNPGAHLLFVLVAALLWSLPEHAYKGMVVGALTAAIVLVAGYRHYSLASHMPWAEYLSYVGRPTAQQQEKLWGVIDWMDEHLPKGAVVGVRDYGRVTLFTDLTIQDISGNIYPQAVTTLNDGTLDQYLKSRGIEYLLLPTLEARGDRLYQYLYSHLKLEPVKDAPSTPRQNLYKVIW